MGDTMNLIPEFSTPEDQFWFALTFSTVVFVFGAFLRECFVDREIRLVGRLLGAAAFFSFAGYSYHATMTCQKQLAEVQNASEVLALDRTTDYLLATPGGATISWRSFNGRATSLPAIEGCRGRDSGTDPESLDPSPGTDDGAGDVRERTFTSARTTGMSQQSTEF